MTIADEAMHLMNQYGGGVQKMPDHIHGTAPRRMTARGILAEAERGIYDKKIVREVLADLKREHEMRMQEGELSTKPIPWYVIVWEGGTIHLETTIISPCRDMTLLQAGADLQAQVSSLGSEDLNLSKCEVTCRPAV